jgi:rhodanese-related sulfurtransferase
MNWRPQALEISTCLRQALSIVAVALIPALLSAGFHPRRPQFAPPRFSDEIEWGEASRLGSRVLWVDARSLEDYQRGHIPGAVSLNLEDWDQLFPRFLDNWRAGKQIVVYCSSRECDLSEAVAARLRASKIEPAFVLKGGWEEWERRNRKQ